MFYCHLNALQYFLLYALIRDLFISQKEPFNSLLKVPKTHIYLIEYNEAFSPPQTIMLSRVNKYFQNRI